MRKKNKQQLNLRYLYDKADEKMSHCVLQRNLVCC